MIKLSDIVNEIKINAPTNQGVLQITPDFQDKYLTKDNTYFPDSFTIHKLTDSLFYLGMLNRSPNIEENYFKKSNIPFTIQPSPNIEGIRYIISSRNIKII